MVDKLELKGGTTEWERCHVCFMRQVACTWQLEERPKGLDLRVPDKVRYDSMDQLTMEYSRQIRCVGPGCGGCATYRRKLTGQYTEMARAKPTDYATHSRRQTTLAKTNMFNL